MPRRRTYAEISLFPFLSVLCSVIGVLVLFVVLVLGTRVIAVEERYQQTEDHQRKPQPGRPKAIEEGIDEQSLKELQAEVDRLTEQLYQRQERRDALQQKLAALQDLIEFKKTELLVPVTVTRPREFDKAEPVAVVPDQGYNVNLRPILVEVHLQGYTIHPAQTQFPAIALDKANASAAPQASPELEKFLRQVKPSKEYLVFLIHPNGVAAFDAMRRYLAEEHEEIRIGWEPFSRNWVVANDR